MCEEGGGGAVWGRGGDITLCQTGNGKTTTNYVQGKAKAPPRKKTPTTSLTTSTTIAKVGAQQWKGSEARRKATTTTTTRVLMPKAGQ